MILWNHRAASYRKENAARMRSAENIQGGEFGGTKERRRRSRTASFLRVWLWGFVLKRPRASTTPQHTKGVYCTTFTIKLERKQWKVLILTRGVKWMEVCHWLCKKAVCWMALKLSPFPFWDHTDHGDIFNWRVGCWLDVRGLLALRQMGSARLIGKWRATMWLPHPYYNIQSEMLNPFPCGTFGAIRLLENQLSYCSSVLLLCPPPNSPPALRMRAAFSFRYRIDGGGFTGSFCCIRQHRETGSAVQAAENCQPSAGARS
jgi:hypothetical protein